MIQPWDPTGACQWDFNTNTGNCPNLVVSGMDYYHEHNHRGTYTPDELPNSPTGDPYLDFVRAYNDPSDDPDGGDPTDISQGRDFKYAYPAGHDAVVKRTDEIDGH
ncbi:MAG: hypothetical protein HY760_09485 [Nitrospirae bacterium]|nr:hypothetical protein [Nitrospirota bacterium]